MTQLAPVIPDYDLIKSIGKGGFGEVWLARQKLTGVMCAVKVIPRDRLGEVELQGIRLYKQRAAGHPHLLALEHVGDAGEFFYYIMELADDARGSGLRDPEGYEPLTLAEHLHRRGALRPGEAVEIITHVLSGLQHLHEAGLLHRDVKPANILLRNGCWKLADLGLTTSHSDLRGQAGTPMYSPPEGVVDRSGDLFCVGRLIGELVTGRASNVEVNPIAIPESDDPRLVHRITDVVARACEIDSSRRYQSAGEFKRQLQHDAGHIDRRQAMITMGLVVFALVAASWWYFGKSRSIAPTQTSSSTMEVYFKPSKDAPEYYKLDESKVPLPTGALVQVHADLGTPGYPYLFGISESKPPVLLDPADSEPVKKVQDFWSPQLSADSGKQVWHRLDPPEGVVMLVLVVSDVPLKDPSNLAGQIKSLRPPALDQYAILSGDPETPVFHWNQQRGFSPRASSSPRGLLGGVAAEWRSSFRSVQIFAFSHSASPSTLTPDRVNP